MNADGGPTRLTNDSAAEGRPAWSPDGSEVLFNSTRDGNQEIYVMNADGSSQTNLSNNSATEDGAVWSPDGSRIAFGSTRGRPLVRHLGDEQRWQQPNKPHEHASSVERSSGLVA
jgi:Tol biopolymer transport system component